MGLLLLSVNGVGQTLTLLSQYSTTTPNCGQVEFYVAKSPGSIYTKFNIAYSTNGGLTFNNYFISTPQNIASYNGLPISISGPDPTISFTGIYRAVFTNGSTNASTVTENSNEIQVTIDPVATIANVGMIVCSGGIFSVSPTNGVDIIPTGTTYSWSAPSISGITGTTSGSGASSIVGTLFNSTNASIDALYTITPLSGSCSGSPFTVTVTVNPNTTITTQPTGYSVCAGGTSTALSVVATGTGSVTYQWYSNTTNSNSGGTLIGSATNASYSPSVSTAGTYYYYVEAISSCSSATSNAVTVTVNPLPIVTVTSTPSSGAVCIGDNATLNGSGASSYTWSGGITNGTAFAPTTTTTYTVTGTDGNGCVNTATKSITVNALPTVTATSTPSSGAVCIGDNATLNGSGASSYTWSGGITNGTAFAPTTTTSYTVTGPDANGCVNTAAKSITVNALPTAAAIIASDNKVMEGSTLNLTAAASGGTAAYTYTWVPNSTINYNIIGGANALFNALKEGSVSIKYQVKDANNCLAQSTDFTITIAPLLFIFEVPNAFTPNGDGLNDILKIIGNSGVKELKGFKIYSRSGNLVFETRDLSVGWDGRFKGNMLPSDIYYWTAVYVDRNDQTNSKTGTVLLLK